MKAFSHILLAAFLALSLNASEKADEEMEDLPSKTGFLSTKWCVDGGYFSDCRLESFLCGEGGCYKKWNPGDEETAELVLFVHDEGKAYKLDISKLPRHELDEGVARNEVEIIGEIKDGTIIAHEFKAPPPPKKSFFKGCL